VVFFTAHSAQQLFSQPQPNQTHPDQSFVGLWLFKKIVLALAFRLNQLFLEESNILEKPIRKYGF
jgi:hypothetical protein